MREQTVTVTVPMERLLRLRTMAWAGMHLLAATETIDPDAEDIDHGLDDPDEGMICRVSRWEFENASAAMRRLPLEPNDLMDGYQTLSIGPSQQEAAALRAEWGPAS